LLTQLSLKLAALLRQPLTFQLLPLPETIGYVAKFS